MILFLDFSCSFFIYLMQLESKLKKSYSDLIEERALNKALSENQSGWQKRVSVLEESLNGYKLTKEKVC